MQKGPVLEFPCQECEATVRVGVTQNEEQPTSATCSQCKKNMNLAMRDYNGR